MRKAWLQYGLGTFIAGVLVLGSVLYLCLEWNAWQRRGFVVHQGSGASSICATPSPSRIVMGCEDETLVEFDTNELIISNTFTLPGKSGVGIAGSRISPKGIVSGYQDDSTYCLFDAELKKSILRLPGAPQIVGQSEAFSPNGRWYATSVENGIMIYDLESLAHNLIAGHSSVSGFWCVRFSVDGTRLAALQANGPLQVFNVKTGELIGKWEIPICNRVVFSECGNDMAVFARAARATISIIYFGPNEGKEVSISARHEVIDVLFSPDGDNVVTMDTSGWLQLWSKCDGRLLREKQLPDESHILAFSPDGQSLAIGDLGGTLILGIPDFGPLARLEAPQDMGLSVGKFSNNGRILVVAGNTSLVGFWVKRHSERWYWLLQSPVAWWGIASLVFLVKCVSKRFVRLGSVSVQKVMKESNGPNRPCQK